MRHLEPEMPIHTFSYISSDPAFSEERWVDIVNAHVGAEAHKVYVTPADLAKDLPDLIRTQGEPFGSTNMYAQYRVFQKAREDGVTVVLEGQGADELLAGYHGYAGQRMRSLLETKDLRGMVTFAHNWKRWPGREKGAPWRALVGQLIPDTVYRAALRFIGIDPLPEWMNREALERESISTRPVRLRRSADGKGRRVAEVLSLALTEGGLPSLLRYGDRNAMRFSVENRVPFLTLPLAEFLLHLPEQYLISAKGETKSVFRAAMRGIMPDAIVDRRDKIGFDTPMKNWLLPMIKTIMEQIERTRQPAFLSGDRINVYLAEAVHDSKPLNWQIWRLVNLYWWSGLMVEPNTRSACSSGLGLPRA
jgi:asparagine synthase (glutamine-hydrolysing)